MMTRMLTTLLAVVLLVALTASCARADSPYANAETPLTLFAINVGKGDALLLNAGNDTYLIDTGLQEHWGDVSRALKMLQVTHLTGVILTHTDKDHAGGLTALATSSIQVDAWYAPASYTGVKEKKHPAVTAAALRGQSVSWLQAGDELPLGTGTLKVLGPLSTSEVENCNSLVLLAEGSGGCMLLAGDMEFPEEEELLVAGLIPQCDVIKIGNHGEGDATSTALIQAVMPKIAVISTSTAEEPDTPDSRVIKLLATAGAKVYQTQNADSGVLVTIEEGKAEANLMHYRDLPDKAEGVVIADVDSEDDFVTLRNNGSAAADLSGWYIVSDRGGEIFVLPEGAAIAPGGTLTIGSLSTEGAVDLTWPEKNVWHDKKDDAAILYDVYGRQIDKME